MFIPKAIKREEQRKKARVDFSEKQLAFMYDKGKRLNFLSGSVRSGKTYISLLKWALWIAEQPFDREFMMVGKTIGSLKRNCLNLLQTMVGEANFSYSANNKSALLFNHVIHLEGANDERSENKIRGMTLGGAYCDEITLYPQSFVSMLLSRLSVSGAKLWATCNPDTPTHYIKKEYLDNDNIIDKMVWNFYLDDNIFLDAEYVEAVKREYSGVFYQRFILGQWVRAEGVIYTDFANNPSKFIIKELPKDAKGKPIKFKQVTIGIDFGGNKSATTFVCTGITDGYKDLYVLENKYIKAQITPEDLDFMFVKFFKECESRYGHIQYVFCDSAEQILIRGLWRIAQKHKLRTTVGNAKKTPINDRIQTTMRMIAGGRFYILEHCKQVVDALRDSVWDEKRPDERLDDGTTDIDTLDAFEYSFEGFAKQLTDNIMIRE